MSYLLVVALAATIATLAPRAEAQPVEGVARVGDRVWVDVNLDGVQGADEPGIGNIAVELWSVTPFGEPFEAVVVTTSDGLGNYQLDVAPGNYRLRVTLPDQDTAFTLADVGADDVDSDVVDAGDGTGLSDMITLAAGQVVTDLDVGLHSADGASLASIGSSVWHDVDRDGERGVFDEPMRSVGVEIRDAANLPIAEGSTDSAGRYDFEVAPGTYRVVFDVPDGFEPATGSELDGDNATPLLRYDAGTLVIDFGNGFVGPGGNVFGEVFFDTNGDGVNDANDLLAPNIGVDLYRDGQIVDTTVTEDDGTYAFVGVDPVGAYQIRMFGRPDLVWSGPDLDADGRSAEFAFEASGTMRIDGALAAPPQETTITFTSPRSLPQDTWARLVVDGTTTEWDFSPFDVTAVVDQTLIVVVDLNPDGAWDQQSLECTDGVSAQFRISHSLRYPSYWEVTASDAGPHECVVEADYFLDEALDVVISVVAPPEAGIVPVYLTWAPDVGGGYLGKVALPDAPATFRVPAVAGGAEWFVREDSPFEPTVSCDLADPVIAPRVGFDFDPTGLGGTTVNCTIELVEPMPELVTVTYTKVAPVLDTTFEVEGFGNLSAGESVTSQLALPLEIVEDLPDGFDLVDVVCTDGVWTETFTSNSFFVVSTLDQAVPGATIHCTSTSVVSPDDAELVITRIGPPGTTTIAVVFGLSVFTLDDTVTIRSKPRRVELLIEPPADQRLVTLSCGDVDVTRWPGTGRVSLTAPSGRTDCTLTTEIADDPPVEVHLRTVVPDDAVELPEVYVYDAEGELYFDADGAVLTQRLGTGEINGVGFSVLATTPWELTEVTCTGEVTVTSDERKSGEIRRSAVTVGFGAGVEPGSRVDCDVFVERLPSVPLHIEVLGAPAGVEVPLRLDQVPAGSISPDAELTLDIAVDRESYVTFEAGPVGLIPASIDCDYRGAEVPVAGRTGLLLVVTVEPFLIPDAIHCTVQMAAASGGRLQLRTEVEGTEGNGSIRFDIDHGYSRPGDVALASATLEQRDTRDFELIADLVSVRPTLPPAWESAGVACDRGVRDLLEDGSVRLSLARATPTECVFTVRLVRPDELGVPGDANCDATVDVIDALVIAQFEAQVRSGGAACPLGDAATELFTGAADFDGSGGIDILDALQVARCSVGLPAAACPAAAAD